MALSEVPVERGNRFLYHKTTHRSVYETRRAGHPSVDEVILQNEEGELTEGTMANLVVKLGGELCTPPVSAGLLPGTFREELLKRGALEERTLYPADLVEAEGLYLVNAVRGWRPAIMS